MARVTTTVVSLALRRHHRRTNRTVSPGHPFARRRDVFPIKRFVYVLRSEFHRNRYYTGLTSNVAARLEAHNAGRCSHTASGRPWRVDVVVEFGNEERAVRFERYLKSGPGNAFAERHLP
jgi:putative endonuclease